MKGTFKVYRVLANTVGVMLIILVLVGLPLHYGHFFFDAQFLESPLQPGVNSTAGWGWRLGSAISLYLGVAHGWLYMFFVVTTFRLSVKARWEIGFTLTTLLCGTIPILSFWSEHRASARLRSEYPELVSDAATA